MALKNRERVSFTLMLGLWDKVRELSKESRIPISRLMDEAILDLLNKCKKDEK